MFKKFKMWFVGGVAAVAGVIGGVQWEKATQDIAKKLEETGAKSQCEARVTTDTCSIDQACRWDFDNKVCVEKK